MVKYLTIFTQLQEGAMCRIELRGYLMNDEADIAEELEPSDDPLDSWLDGAAFGV